MIDLQSTSQPGVYLREPQDAFRAAIAKGLFSPIGAERYMYIMTLGTPPEGGGKPCYRDGFKHCLTRQYVWNYWE